MMILKANMQKKAQQILFKSIKKQKKREKCIDLNFRINLLNKAKFTKEKKLLLSMEKKRELMILNNFSIISISYKEAISLKMKSILMNTNFWSKWMFNIFSRSSIKYKTLAEMNTKVIFNFTILKWMSRKLLSSQVQALMSLRCSLEVNSIFWSIFSILLIGSIKLKSMRKNWLSMKLSPMKRFIKEF